MLRPFFILSLEAELPFTNDDTETKTKKKRKIKDHLTRFHKVQFQCNFLIILL